MKRIKRSVTQGAATIPVAVIARILKAPPSKVREVAKLIQAALRS
jgi:hypothetical protein